MNCTTELNINVVAADCNSVAVAGIEGKAIIIPFDYIDHSAIQADPDIVNSDAILGVPLKAGKKGISFDTLNNSAIGSVTLNQGTYRDTVAHNITLRAFLKNYKIKTAINSLLNSRVVICVLNNERGRGGTVQPAFDTAFFEVYGLNSGLILSAVNGDTTFADTVTYELVFNSDDLSQETTLPRAVTVDSGEEDLRIIFNSLAL